VSTFKAVHVDFQIHSFIAKTLFFSSLFYGRIVWIKTSNMNDIDALWYNVSKAAVGVVFNVSSVILEVILGVPPLQISA
jgi:hypothetical protein